MHEGDIDAPPATPSIPAQRTPPPLESVDPQAPLSPRGRRGPLIAIAAVLAATLALLISMLVQDRPAGIPAKAAEVTSAPPVPLTPYESMLASLRDQAAAVVRGDEQGWLNAVDPRQAKLRAQYRTMYRSLRGLGVTQFGYSPGVNTPDKKGTITTDIWLCFNLTTCTLDMAPTIRQKLTLSPVRGRYRITRLWKSSEQTDLQPMPWESGTLVVQTGKRVIVAAAPSEAKHLKQVIALADKAAVATDRVARYVANPVTRYRIFLADGKTWRSWYGGIQDKTTIGLEVPLNQAESDVVLKMSALRDPAELARTIQHEMGHVVTVGAAKETGGFLYRDNQWLSEGVAEYIEWSPKGATASYRRDSVRFAVNGSQRPKTIAAKPLSEKAGTRTVDAFYGLGHFAVDCMAHTFGERKMYEFVRLRLREGLSLDGASRQAYGKPFPTVDQTCVSWIRQQV